MSFPIHKTIHVKYTKMQRKENDSLLAHHFVHKFHLFKERAFAFTSKGSITLEAAIATVFFFLGALCLVITFETILLQTKVKSALHAVAKEVAVEVCTNPMIPTTEMEKKIAEFIGKEELDKSFIVGGSKGFDCSNSKKYWNTTIMDLSVQYKIRISIFMFRIPTILQEEVIRVKGWTGYEEKRTDDVENVMVYVTDYGIVYHKDLNCTYIELSTKRVTAEEALQRRNQRGEKYQACQYCNRDSENQQKVYITDYGTRYHASLDCKGLKRGIYVVPLTDIKGLGGCSKCVE